ncbi:MAG: DNA-binding protein [Candidatus Bathyarchaeota archaeon]|nr:DNA-binding protein [Candidatus Bathyarchaeota archaeon]MCX8176816.1 DNA-binding protein [Candidatus Bathyarchaeota archaeon]MDW8193345.1 DNA-binding protein [Nitrososphaerota archaeon]
MEAYRIRNNKIEKCKREKLKVILDANAFFVPLKFKIDIFEELRSLLNRNFEPILLSPVKKELEKMVKEESPKMRKEALYALKMAEKCSLLEVDENYQGSPDDAIVHVAQKLECPVFTNDKELKRRLRNINVPVIYVRQKSQLEVDGRI